MHPDIAAFPAAHFYQGRVRNAREEIANLELARRAGIEVYVCPRGGGRASSAVRGAHVRVFEF